jgi:hypothetical protein
MTVPEPLLRVSAATLNRVVLAGAPGAAPVLALERTATVLDQPGGKTVRVRAQPFGGAVRIRDLAALDDFGGWRFASPNSQAERDFRILIPPENWHLVRQFCLNRLADPADPVLDACPHRELAEEFADSLGVDLSPAQYSILPAGFVVENQPSPTDNTSAAGLPTVRIYRIYNVQITDPVLCSALLRSSAVTDSALQAQALTDAASGGKGRANAALTLPLQRIIDAYQSLPLAQRCHPLRLDGHTIASSTAAILPEIITPHFQRPSG